MLIFIIMIVFILSDQCETLRTLGTGEVNRKLGKGRDPGWPGREENPGWVL